MVLNFSRVRLLAAFPLNELGRFEPIMCKYYPHATAPSRPVTRSQIVAYLPLGYGFLPISGQSFSNSFLAFYHGLHGFGDQLTVTQSKRVWLSQAVPNDNVALARTLISPNKYIAQQLDAVEFVHPKGSIYISLLRYVDKRYRAKVLANQRNIRRQPRRACLHPRTGASALPGGHAGGFEVDDS